MEKPGILVKSLFLFLQTEFYMVKPRVLVKSLFLFLQTEFDMLMQIEFFVVVIAIIFLIMSFLDLYRLRSRSPAIKYVLLILDAMSQSTYIYTIGLMQNAPFKKDLFPVWALLLVNLQCNVCFVSAYSIPVHDNMQIRELVTVMSLLGVGFLNGTLNSQFKYPIWALWWMLIIRALYLMYAHRCATDSVLHGWSSLLLVEYMETTNVVSPQADPDTMEGYKYLVIGDDKQKIEVKVPKYHLDMRVTFPRTLVTLDKIWRSRLLNNQGNRAHDIQLMKDMCLSFALYRLLRCKFDDLSLPGDSIDNIKRLISRMIQDNDMDRAFRTVESELAFLNDYCYTRYPVLFWRGVPLLASWHPILTMAFVLWLARDIHKKYKPPVGETAIVINGINVDIIITWIFMGGVVLKELWKMVTYMLSNWTKVTVLCKYVEDNWWARNRLVCNLVLPLCSPRFKIVHSWHRTINQYEFLQSFVYNPWKWNVLYYLSLGMIPPRIVGDKPSSQITLPEEVKHAILRSLRLVNLTEVRGCLPCDMPSLQANDHLKWAVQLPTCSHVILVWHIATSLSEIELAQHYNACLTYSEVLGALKSALKCFSSQPYVIKIERLELDGALRANYIVANSLSRYCAYLLLSEPGFLPDGYFVPDLIFQNTVAEASKVLHGCDTLQSMYRRLVREGDEQQHKNGDGGDIEKHHPGTIIEEAANLGRLLRKTFRDDNIARWKLLAEVWADLLLHLAPSWNAAAHMKCLATGGEFITHIWAILSHCAIESSNLWPQQQVRDDRQAAEQHGTVGREEAQAQQQAAGDDPVAAQQGAPRSDHRAATSKHAAATEGDEIQEVAAKRNG